MIILEGIGNMFYIASNNHWAITYTSQAVLESMHAAILLKLLLKNDYFGGWKADVYQLEIISIYLAC